ncbi:beta-glucosidase [Pullulanibacillus pueri]|uniref:beta-glucosidase n=1 Tax=Pullulanibacillus pueri TaxID=1437324 RepID=A0A8J2ZUG4_9BACL|nr:beta-glucosidase BglX [Pullulanibacillus pueri]MBM7680827.1 beta-glucosidase [Pullulanibacillus pueri]GGH78486.1 beta-glucosidase [Pullulanibacillus pueri]
MEEDYLYHLLEQMTIDEKIGQLLQLATPFFKGSSTKGQITGPMKEMGVTEEVVENAGSVLGASGAKEISNIQKKHLESNRLGIPLLMMSDIVHGFKTIFPIPLAIGCSWDLELARHAAEIAAKEAAVSGIHVTFAPMVDLVRDPRWGRVMESTGEDPYLNGLFAKAQVHGFQGNDLTDTKRVAACVKHFAAYGAVEGGRDYNTVDMSEWQLRESYLPAYKMALDAGCEMVMTAFTTMNGIPASGNRTLMRKILREEWGFDGVVISDWGALKELIPHGVAEDEKEAALKALQSGVDIEMMTLCYTSHLKELVATGEIEEQLIDESVMRILKLKNKLGLFENPLRGANETLEKDIVFSAPHREVARQLATKASVLLKNDDVLPLSQDQKVALIGPFADNHDVLGQWSWLGSKEDAVTLKEGLETQLKSENLNVAKGCDVESRDERESKIALQIAREADVIILALGEHSWMSGEAGSRTNIKLPKAQLNLLNDLKQLNKPIVVVLFNGRPLDLMDVTEKADAILEAWYPGSEAGNALADLLFGNVNPSGKLTMSFPRAVGQIPTYYNHYNTGRPKGAPDAQERYVSQYLDSSNGPLFPFGFGLSYTSFEYKDAHLSSNIMKQNETIRLSVKVENIGEVIGEEVVQFYIRDLTGEVIRPLKELKGFERITLQPGEQKEITFTITEKQLRYYHSDLSYKSDKGKFMAYVGSNSQDVLAVPFQLM